jgi:hypothetical protein
MQQFTLVRGHADLGSLDTQGLQQFSLVRRHADLPKVDVFRQGSRVR